MRLKRWQWLMVAGLYPSAIVMFAYWYGFGALIPYIMEDLKINYAQAGLIASAVVAGYLPSTLIFGFIADKLNASKKILVPIIALTAAPMFAFGSLAMTYVQALLIRLISGIEEGGWFTPSIRLISQWFEEENRAWPIAVFISGNFLGSAICLEVALWCALTFGWRSYFYLMAASALVSAFMILVVVKDRPEDVGLSLDQSAERSVIPDSGASIFRIPEVWVIAIQGFCALFTFGGFFTWIVPYLIEIQGIEPLIAGYVGLLAGLTIALTEALGGWFSDKTRRRAPWLVAGWGGGAVMCFALAVSSTYQIPLLIITIILIAWTIPMGLPHGVQFTAMSQVVRAQRAGTGSGVLDVSCASGAMLAPPFFGFTIDVTHTFTYGFVLIGVSALVAALLIITRYNYLP
jgi:predicted MFS family arabinose efflux permease